MCNLIAVSSVIKTLRSLFSQSLAYVCAYYLYVELKCLKTMIKSKYGDFLSLNTYHQFIFPVRTALAYDKLSPKDSSY